MRIHYTHFEQKVVRKLFSFCHVGILSNDNLINFCFSQYSQQILIQLKFNFQDGNCWEKETVTSKTFLKWRCQEDFKYETDDEDNIIKLTCKVCSTYLPQIQVEDQKGNVCG